MMQILHRTLKIDRTITELISDTSVIHFAVLSDDSDIYTYIRNKFAAYVEENIKNDEPLYGSIVIHVDYEDYEYPTLLLVTPRFDMNAYFYIEE